MYCKLSQIIRLVLVFLITSVSNAQRIDMPVVHVGDVGNAPDPLTRRGAVNYDYCIGKYDITIAEYTAFLNAVAKRDKYRLYSPHKMDQIGRAINSETVNDTGPRWEVGIARSGKDGSYTYSVIGTSGSMPVVATWFDAARFCNWMHNGQPTDLGEEAGSTETGAYTLNGDCRKGGQPRNPCAKWWIPSADEWYKAAYYDPRLNEGAGGYWRYATQNNEAPGNTIGSGSNEANAIANGTFAVKAKLGQKICMFTPVGAFTNTCSY
jgi:formylglycine-generating enzyme